MLIVWLFQSFFPRTVKNVWLVINRRSKSLWIVLAGIYRAVPMRVNPRQSNVKSVYKTHIDAIHFRKTDEKRLHGLDEEAEQKLFTEDRVQTLKELAAKPDVYERLSSALAPSIYEHEDIKKVSECKPNCFGYRIHFDFSST